MKLPQSIYEIARWLTWIVLPATATLISALNAAWGWNLQIDAILSTFVAVETFIGVVLGIAKYSYDNAPSEPNETLSEYLEVEFPATPKKTKTARKKATKKAAPKDGVGKA